MNCPRAVYLDFPLGHTAGKAHDKALQRKIMIDALSALDAIQIPGTIRELPYRWAADDLWKDSVMRPDKTTGEHADNRTVRNAKPVYQTEEDQRRATANLQSAGCPGCVWLEEPATG